MFQQANPKSRSTHFTISSNNRTQEFIDTQNQGLRQEEQQHFFGNTNFDKSNQQIQDTQIQDYPVNFADKRKNRQEKLQLNFSKVNPFQQARQKISRQTQQVEAFITSRFKKKSPEKIQNSHVFYKQTEQSEKEVIRSHNKIFNCETQRKRQNQQKLPLKNSSNYLSSFKIKKISNTFRSSYNSEQKNINEINLGQQVLRKKQITNKNPQVDPSTALRNSYNNRKYQANLSYFAQTNTKIIDISQNPQIVLQSKNKQRHVFSNVDKEHIRNIFKQKRVLKLETPQTKNVYKKYTQTLRKDKFSKSIAQISHELMIQQYAKILKNSIKKQTSPQVINSIFQSFFQHVKIQIPINPLIKQYRNGIYFGQNKNLLQNQQYQGVLFYHDNKIYYGGFLNEKKSGKGVQIQFTELKQMKKILKGCFSSNNTNEKFILITPNYFYHGGISNGKMCGQGKLTTNLSTYEGQFFNDMRHGFGKQILNSGLILEGQFYENKFTDVNKDQLAKNITQKLSNNLRIKTKKQQKNLIQFNYQYVDQSL